MEYLRPLAQAVLLIYLFSICHALTAALVTSITLRRSLLALASSAAVTLRRSLLALASSAAVLFIFGTVLQRAKV